MLAIGLAEMKGRGATRHFSESAPSYTATTDWHGCTARRCAWPPSAIPADLVDVHGSTYTCLGANLPFNTCGGASIVRKLTRVVGEPPNCIPLMLSL